MRKPDNGDGVGVGLIAVCHSGIGLIAQTGALFFYIREEITGRTLKSKRKSELGAVAG